MVMLRINEGTTINGFNEETRESEIYGGTLDGEMMIVKIVKTTPGLADTSYLLRGGIQGNDISMLLNAKETYMIGRHDKNTGFVPDIDLSKYGAYQLGISRQHAIIRWENQQLYLFDLGSRNGTYINGLRAIPRQPCKLSEGDEIRFGKLKLTIYNKTRAEA